MEIKVYLVLATILSLVGIFEGVISFRKENKTGKYLGAACFLAVLCTLSFLISALADTKTQIALSSSLYFIFIDFTVFFLVCFIFNYCSYSQNWKVKTFVIVCLVGLVYEVVIFTINIFKPIAIDYIFDLEAEYAKYSYDMKPLFFVHLGFTYVMLVYIVIMLLIRMISVPKHYKSQYLNIVFMLAVIVGVNAVFLYNDSLRLDYSVLLYIIAAVFCYWATFWYTKHNMLNRFKSVVVDTVDLGVVLFDYKDNFLMANKSAEKLLENIKLNEKLSVNSFTEFLGLYLNESFDKSTSICYVKRSDGLLSLRCEYSRFVDNKGKSEGRLFILTSEALELDLHTGFHSWESFLSYLDTPNKSFTYPIEVSVIDINSMSVINSIHGKRKGDELIRTLANMMRERLPKNSTFVRGVDAKLIALTFNRTTDEIVEIMDRIKRDFETSCQYAVSVAKDEDDVLSAINEATDAMISKKLLDQKSIHSSMLTSLISALEECDSDTEEHVQRTQEMGKKLGARLNLSDSEQSNLSLLCILHDIGKIGIPLEILNKPAKLNEDEWELMKSHVEKGYNIAKSSPALEGIADMIRYHHERWDGKGYPDGLSRESIPLLSRIISVVDAFDAMTHDRIYRKAMSVDSALNELVRCAGTQFDPTIVTEFVALIEEEYKGNIAENKPENNESNAVNQEAQANKANKTNKTVTGNVYTIPFGHYITDSEERVLSANDSFYSMTGYTKEDVDAGLVTHLNLIPEEDKTDYIIHLQEALAGKNQALIEHRIKCKDGSIITVLCLGRSFYDSVTKKPQNEIFIINVINTNAVKMLAKKEEAKSQKRLIQWESTYRKDSLTNVYNHAAFKSDVDLILLKTNKKVLFAMLDVDKFKNINDTYGHHYGDEVLIFLAQTIQDTIDKDDYLCRMGGDEFAIFISADKETPDSVLEEKIQKIHKIVTTTLAASKNGCTISMGAVISDTVYNFNELYGASDKQLYISKEKGRNRLSITHLNENN